MIGSGWRGLLSLNQKKPVGQLSVSEFEILIWKFCALVLRNECREGLRAWIWFFKKRRISHQSWISCEETPIDMVWHPVSLQTKPKLLWYIVLEIISLLSLSEIGVGWLVGDKNWDLKSSQVKLIHGKIWV